MNNTNSYSELLSRLFSQATTVAVSYRGIFVRIAAFKSRFVYTGEFQQQWASFLKPDM